MAKTKQTKQTKGTKKVVEEKVVEEVVEEVVEKVEAPVSETVDVVVEDPFAEISTDFASLVEQLRAVQNTIRDLSTFASKLEKRVVKEGRLLAKKANGKKKRRVTNGEPSGFSKPGQVSDDLRSFLSLGKDELIARTDVTRRITEYCRKHGLQDQKDKRILLPDKKLKNLLNIKKGDQLTFFNLQKYMKVHFPNKEGVFPTA
jgi:chromatin remodeling complex protein RSC6